MLPTPFAHRLLIQTMSGWLLASTATLMASTPMPLHEAYRDAFHIGGALSSLVYVENDPSRSAIAQDQFSLVVAENDMKWGSLRPSNETYNFSRSDAFVGWALQRGKKIHGHVLVWHEQTPAATFTHTSGRDLTRDELIARMQDHIRTVMGRYKGLIQSWDVVNEAFDDNGNLRNSPWRRIIGDDFIEIAFRTAREADPNAILVYNDYSLANNSKRAGVLRMVGDFRQRGVPIDAVGEQGHWQLGYPSLTQIERIITDIMEAGVQVMITELDIDVLPSAWEHVGADISQRFELQESLNPYTLRLPTRVSREQSERYESVFQLFLKYRHAIYTITFWGVTDRESWLNNFPMRGRTNYPMLFGRDGHAKPAFYSVLRVAPNPVRFETNAVEPYRLIPIHRYYRRGNDSHFFTANQGEHDYLQGLISRGNWVYDGVSHHVIENHTLQSHPVFRLFNRLSGSHFYTASQEEMLGVLSNPEAIFQYEGIAFYSLLSPEPGSMSVYRFFAGPTASHFFTIDEAEKNILQGSKHPSILSLDGVAWFAFP